MASVSRRTVVQLLAAFPGVARAISAFQQSPGAGLGGRDLAVQVLRMVNTAEQWHHTEFGSYVDIENLMESPALARLRADGVAEGFGIGASLLSQVSLEGTEVLPGWRLDVWLRPEAAQEKDSNGYVAAVWDVSGENGYGLASDDSGRIYEGSAASGSSYLGEPRTVQDLLPHGAPLCGGPAGGPVRRALGGLLEEAAFLTLGVQPATIQCCCPCGPPGCVNCPVSCSCCSGAGTGGYNCGCGSCAWIQCHGICQ
jgi:hypothetical protein